MPTVRQQVNYKQYVEDMKKQEPIPPIPSFLEWLVAEKLSDENSSDIWIKDPDAVALIAFPDDYEYVSFLKPSEILIEHGYKRKLIVNANGNQLDNPVWVIARITHSGPIGMSPSERVVSSGQTEKRTKRAKSPLSIPKSAKQSKGGGDNIRVHLKEIPEARGGEKLFLKVWSEMPESTGTVITLADAFDKAGAKQANAVKSARWYIKKHLKNGFAEIAK